jgi:hypothetical protein
MSYSAPLALNMALVSAGLLGLRHGLDYDHVAAISDIAAVQRGPVQAMKMGLMYTIGHAATVAVLGSAVILFHFSLPAAIDAWLHPLVGITLLVLGGYVLWTTVVQRSVRHSHLPQTRLILLWNAALWSFWRLRALHGSTAAPPPAVRRMGRIPAITVGIIHGVGAETPTQLMLFLLAANLGGITTGLLGLGSFLLGMLLMNSLVCAAATGVFRASIRRPGVLQCAAAISAAFSMALGALFLTGTSGVAAVLRR